MEESKAYDREQIKKYIDQIEFKDENIGMAMN